MKKNLTITEMTPKPFELTQNKNIHKIFKLPKYSFFYPHPPPPTKNALKFKNLNPKNDMSLRMCENIRVHPPPGTGPGYMSTKYQG